jgi:hypothetical protein
VGSQGVAWARALVSQNAIFRILICAHGRAAAAPAPRANPYFKWQPYPEGR